MEKLTALNLSFDRVLIQLLIPGLLASFPMLALYFDRQPDFIRALSGDSIAYLVTFVVLIALIIGLVIEDIGSRIEVYFFDNNLKIKDADFDETWKKYLQLSYANEPIGQRYLRNILLRMKFELSMSIAFLIMSAGMHVYKYYFTVFFNPFMNYLILLILPVLGAAYLLYEAWESAKVLHTTRKWLVDKYFGKI